MGWSNDPDLSWPALERLLSSRTGTSLTGASSSIEPDRGGAGQGADGVVGDGGDSPAWSRKREPYVPPEGARLRLVDPGRVARDVERDPPGRTGAGRVERVRPYAELHCHSNFSFLDGASHPGELVEEAHRLGLETLALTDHDGMYGVVQFAEAAKALGIATVFGAELSLGLPAPQNGVPDPVGDHLLVLARGPDGYRALCRTISAAQMEGREKGRPVYRLARVVEDLAGHVVVLTGCRKGSVRRALAERGIGAAAAALRELVERFGAENVLVELTDHGGPTDIERNDALAKLAEDAGLLTVATNAVHYARPEAFALASALAAVRSRRSLDEIEGWLPASSAAHLRGGAEMAVRFDARYPGAVDRAAALGRELAFELSLVAPKLPPFTDDRGRSEAALLRERVRLGAAERYGGYAENPEAIAMVDYEMEIIENQDFPGYFLIVHDIVSFCRSRGILCQGRGSAANSAVCFALGITNVDAVGHGLLFERFLSPARGGYPDIDLDIEAGRREEVIQYVYATYQRTHAAQVANVITYRPRSAVRDMARALGFSQGQQDAWSRRIDRWAPPGESVGDGTEDLPGRVRELADQVLGFPRHLGIHSGGMVICDRPVSEVVPVEWARKADRSVIQWDKDDCAAIGLVKFDLLGLGMLTALSKMITLVKEHHGRTVDLHELPADPEVFDMLCAADSVGVFQVESRAQIATLPRLKPRNFYDLAVEVALIRPGPIQGGSVHPYIRRREEQRQGLRSSDSYYDHPLLANALRKTLGVPLFQEQLMQIAVDVAGFSPAEADELRRAMGAKRSVERMLRLRERLFDGMAANGITGELAERIFRKMVAFANFGFPESHAISFASLVYQSAWFKYHYPAAFCVALVNSQPMGFYSPNSLIADARRHGVVARGPDINLSEAGATLERGDREDRPDIRLGLAGIRAIGDELAEGIVAERRRDVPYRDLADLARRVRLTVPQAEALATAGALGCFGVSRRSALWAAGVIAGHRPTQLPGTAVGLHAPPLPGMTPAEVTICDVWATGVSPDSHPIAHLRESLDAREAVPITGLTRVRDGTRIRVGGLVTHRQRPATAGGITFLNLEDETGMLNVVCAPGVWNRYRATAMSASALVVRGRLERSPEGVLNLVADRLERLSLTVLVRSRDFR